MMLVTISNKILNLKFFLLIQHFASKSAKCQNNGKNDPTSGTPPRGTIFQDPNSESKNRNKNYKMSDLEVFSNFNIHFNFRQTSAINMTFLHRLYAVNSTANQRI